MSNWAIIIDTSYEYYVLKKNKQSKEYMLVKKSLGRRGNDILLESFTAKTDEIAIKVGRRLARKYGLKGLLYLAENYVP